MPVKCRALYRPFSIFIVFVSLMASFPVLPAAAQTVDSAYTWNLGDIYSSPDQWQNDCDRISRDLIPAVESHKGKLNDPAELRACLQDQENLMRALDKVYFYAGLAADLNQGDDKASERNSQASALYSKAAGAASYIEPELLALPASYLQDLQKDPFYLPYRHYFEALVKRQAHTLSAPEEALLAAAMELASGPEDIYSKLTTVEMTFPPIRNENGDIIDVTESQYINALSDPDRKFREEAYASIMDGYRGYSYTLAATLEAQVKTDVFFARARKYDTALDCALDSEEVPRSVYDNLVDGVNQNLAPLHRYVRLRQKILGLDRVRHYDMYVPLVPQVNRQFTYDDARNLVIEGLNPLGTDYTSTLKSGLNHRWVDVYPATNKSTGAFAWAIYDYHPYILLNYTGTYDGVLDLAHESGHAMEFLYTNRQQQYINSGTPLIVQEAASTTNECLVTDYLIKQAHSDEERLFLLDMAAENIVSTFYRQTMYAEFEQQIHTRVENGEGLSPETLNSMWKNLLIKYYGDAFQPDERSAAGWTRIPHFYYDFYVYKYAVDLTAARQFATGLESGDADAAARYRALLSAGSSQYPVDELKEAGVDVTTRQPIDNLVQNFNQILTDMETILKAQGRLNENI